MQRVPQDVERWIFEYATRLGQRFQVYRAIIAVAIVVEQDLLYSERMMRPIERYE